MMSCKEAAHLASDYLERELPPLRRWSLRLHLFMCVDCRRFVDGIQSVVRLASTLRGSADRRKFEDLAHDLTSRFSDGPSGREGGDTGSNDR